MRPRTEALLTLRDGGPIDAALRADLLADADSVAELERLRRVKASLRALPEVDPPDSVWQRVANDLDQAAARRIRAPLRFLAGAAIAAAAAIAAVQLFVRPVEPVQPATPVAEERPRASSRPLFPPTYVALVEESERLERLLARIPYQRPMMSGRTASTIVGLEDRIAYVDAQLTFASAYDMEMPEREALWGERVELMNALLHVRYAQAQRTGF
jgi:hypothetical protein